MWVYRDQPPFEPLLVAGQCAHSLQTLWCRYLPLQCKTGCCTCAAFVMLIRSNCHRPFGAFCPTRCLSQGPQLAAAMSLLETPSPSKIKFGWLRWKHDPTSKYPFLLGKCLTFPFNSGIHESFLGDLATKGTTLGATGAVGLAAIASSTRGRRGPFLRVGSMVGWSLSCPVCIII